MECCTYCFNFCTLLSCLGDSRDAISKLFPCMRKKEEPPKFKEETYKVTFLGHTILDFEKI